MTTELSSQDWVDLDWLHSTTGNRLHHTTLTAGQAETLADEGYAAVIADCGTYLCRATIPGPLSRGADSGMPRCARCCTRTGVSRGLGSPKNTRAQHTDGDQPGTSPRTGPDDHTQAAS